MSNNIKKETYSHLSSYMVQTYLVVKIALNNPDLCTNVVPACEEFQINK